MNRELIAVRNTIERTLDELIPTEGLISETLSEAMRYATLSGGKRIRPLLLCSSCTGLGGNINEAIFPACAVEMVHAYSLIHDDLPSMDNDKLRHGKDSTHIAFGEAIAILSGDALQALAFELLTKPNSGISHSIQIETIRLLSTAAGSKGMVGGQVLDLESENKRLDLEELNTLHRSKTGALIAASIEIGATLATNADKEQVLILQEFSDKIGLAFQVVDDILDVTQPTKILGKPSQSDLVQQKSTFPQLMGVDEARYFSEKLLAESLQLLKLAKLKNDWLADLARMCVHRNH